MDKIVIRRDRTLRTHGIDRPDKSEREDRQDRQI